MYLIAINPQEFDNSGQESVKTQVMNVFESKTFMQKEPELKIKPITITRD